MIYLDNAATSYQKPTEFYRAMDKGVRKFRVNAGRGGHYFSVIGADRVSETGEKLAELFGADNPERIAFSYNATMSLNQAIGGILKKGGHAVVTQMEHNSVLRPVNRYGNYTVAEANERGYVSAADIEAAIRPDTRLIVCTHCSNVCGSIQPVEEIIKLAKKHGILFLLDAAQTAGCYPINIKNLGADMVAFSGHKGLMGPQGTGGLYVRDGVKITPIISGGTGSRSDSIIQPDYMPDMLQSGTVNVPGIIALGEACKLIERETPEKIYETESWLAKQFIEDISVIDGVKIYGSMFGNQRNGTVAFNINGMSSTEVSELLDKEYNIAVRAGFHCAPLAHKALKTGGKGCVRVSFGFYNSKRHEKLAAKAICEIAKK